MHTYMHLYREVCLSSRGFLSAGFCPGVFVWKVMFGVVFVRPLLSEYIRYKAKHHFQFYFLYVGNNFEKCHIKCSWTSPPLSQTVTPSLTPSSSSVTYFMSGPKASSERFEGLKIRSIPTAVGMRSAFGNSRPS